MSILFRHDILRGNAAKFAASKDFQPANKPVVREGRGRPTKHRAVLAATAMSAVMVGLGAAPSPAQAQFTRLTGFGDS